MIFSIASVDKNMGIGKDGKLLCRLRADMAFFREKTLGKTVVMGRKTQESLPKGAPLPDRRNIVMTGDRTYKAEGFTVVHSMGEALKAGRTRRHCGNWRRGDLPDFFAGGGLHLFDAV